MTIQETIRQGEGYDLEFKRMPNEDRVKYLKTVIAFANGKGGTILFGVANDGSVPGIDKSRMEITSPGGLPRGLTVEKVLAGRSKIRNHALAEALNYMNVIEQWGSGLRRVSEELAAYGAKPLQLEDGGIDVRVNVFRNAASADNEDNRAANEGNCETNEVNEANHEVNAVNQRIVLVLSHNPKSTIPEMARICNVSRATIDRAVKVLKDSGRIRRVGGTRGHWEVLQGKGRRSEPLPSPSQREGAGK